MLSNLHQLLPIHSLLNKKFNYNKKEYMNYTIEKYDQIITSLSSAGKSNGVIKKEEIENIILQCREEKEKIRLHIMEEVFNASEEKALLLLIDKYQAVFIRLMDQIYAYRKGIKKQDEYHELSKCLFDHLNELLCFLQVHYNRYFNLRQKMPFIKIEHTAKEECSKTATISAALKRTIINDKLTKLVIQPLENFTVCETVTYAQSQYIKNVTKEFLSIDTTAQEDINIILKKILLSLNYNAPDISVHYINELDQLIAEEESVQGKLRILKYQLKEVNQVSVKSDHILHPELPGLKEQIVNWLNEEIYFHEMEQIIVSANPASNGNETKIHTSLSVPQLAMLFRLLKEEQLITNTNQSELLKVVAGNFTTLHKENFSYGHLHGKYYKIEANTKRTVYDILLRLLHLSRKIG
jgi:hypothetical protein